MRIIKKGMVKDQHKKLIDFSLKFTKHALATVVVTTAISSGMAYADDDDNDGDYGKYTEVNGDPNVLFRETKDGIRQWKVKGRPVTGANDVCGEPQWIMPEPFAPDEHFTAVGTFDPTPGATNSIPLNVERCQQDDLLIATHSNDALNALGGFPTPDPRITNIPLRQVQVKAFPDGSRMTLPSQSETIGNPFPPTKSDPNYPITVKEWFKASGEMELVCYPEGNAKLKWKFKGLIPNGVYGAYSVWLTTLPGTNQRTFIPAAFGGVPNITIPNKRGKASFERSLNHCPMDETQDGSIIMFANLAYHFDGTTAGVIPQSASRADTFRGPGGELFESFKTPGVLVVPQVQFPFITGGPIAK